MHLPFNATVYSSDNVCGRVTAIIVEPASKTVTHLVVCQTTRQRLVERLLLDESLVCPSCGYFELVDRPEVAT